MDRSGVERVRTLILYLAILAAVPYLVPGLEKLRAWVPGDPIPFSRVFDFRAPRRASIAGIRRRVKDLSEDEALEVAPLPTADVALDLPKSEPDSELADLRVPPEELAGLTRRIEDGTRLDHFSRRLVAAALQKTGAMARIALFSTSINGSDRISDTMRDQLAERFGDGGKGFVPIAPGWKWQRHQDVEWSAEGWRTLTITRRNAPLHRYGLGGVLAIAGPRAHASYELEPPKEIAGGRLSLLYLEHPRGNKVSLSVDGESFEVDTRAEEVGDGIFEKSLLTSPRRIDVRAKPGARLYGLVVEHDRPGVVVDAYMYIGGFVSRLLEFDVEHLHEQIQFRRPDLLVFWMGANEAAAGIKERGVQRFEENYVKAINRIRAGRRSASCLVLSILDQGEKRGGRVVTQSVVPRMVQATRNIAQRSDCAFFDLFQATGGPGTMRRWRKASPRLVSADYGHLTAAGARLVGLLLTRALLAEYDAYLTRREHSEEKDQ